MGDTERPESKESTGSRSQRKQLHLRERAIARAEELLAAKVEREVNKKLAEMEINPAKINKASKIFDKIAKDYPSTIGKAVSKKEREDDELMEDQSLVYGEIQFRTFALTMEKIKQKYHGLQKPGGTFVDIGSGIGKPVFAAMLLHEFDKVIGIEILRGLHEISMELYDIWCEIKPSAEVSTLTKKTQIELIQGDAFAIDWEDADIAFVNSTCFDKPLMERLAEKADLMKPGAFFISFTRRIPSEKWQVLEYERHLMSWGDATVFIQQRKHDHEVSSEQKDTRE